jgi:hypothetical protein
MNGSICGWCGQKEPDISTHVCNPEEHGWEQDGEYEGIKIMRRKNEEKK